MKLSVILIVHNMARELPRTLESLSRHYQLDADDLDYEVLVVDNGSKQRINESLLKEFGAQFHYHYLDNPPGSPAFAINFGVKAAKGQIIAVMIDGAHILTPGVFKFAMSAFAAFKNPLVMTRYFFMGPGDQNDTLRQGYDQSVEDELFTKISWPQDGYRLFEVGVPFQGRMPKITWYNKMVESNCLFMYRALFEYIGGADERFDYPGGGFLNMDLYKQAVESPGVDPVQLIGEGSFHQIHGGVTTNVSAEDRDQKVHRYGQQYEDLRGKALAVSEKDVFYLGHLPTLQSKIHLRNN
ncbi:MAG: hypothetical protein COB04_12685 [Gammaproteobacteria bacterium]|nr:MAG: hypothetical protein COB04_12685 [Gammaproteobacteria bacterium]